MRRCYVPLVVMLAAGLVGVVALTVAGAGDDAAAWEWAIDLFNRAFALHESARFLEAIDLYEQSLLIIQDLPRPDAEAVILNNLGLCHEALSEYEWAIGCYEQALVIKRDLEDNAGEARSLSGLGNCFYSLSEYHQAIGYYEQLLEIFVEIDDRSGEARCLDRLGICHHSLSEYQHAIDYHEQSLAICVDIVDRSGEAASLGNLGICYHSLSDYHRAIDYCQQALTIYRNIVDRTGEAKSLNTLGLCYCSLSEYQRAIDYHDQSLTIFRDTHDRVGEATSLSGLGNCYFLLSEYQRAIFHFEQTLAICMSIGDRAGQATCLHNLGACYDSLSEYGQAIDYYVHSLAIKREIDDRAGAAASLSGLGNCYLSLSEYEQAIEYHEQSLAIKQEIDDHAGAAASLLNLGLCYLSLSEYRRAMEFFHDALALAEAIADQDSAWRVHWGLGHTYRQLDEFSEALEHYANAVAIVEGIRERVESEGLQQSFFGNLKILYEEYLELLFNVGNEACMLWAAERCRARSMLDLLTHGGAASNEALEGMTVQGTVDANGIQSLLDDAPALLEEDEAVLVYAWGTEHLFTWVMTSDQGIQGPYAQEIAYEEALDRIYTFRSRLETLTDRSQMFADLVWLWNLLIEPVYEQIEGCDTWVVVPSGPLWYVPYAALRASDGEATYAIEGHVIAYAPSIASLSSMLREQEEAASVPACALVNPIRSDLASLPAGLATAMESFLTGFGSDCVYSGEAASEERLREMLSEGASYQYLALACHGIFRHGNPLYSYLALTPTAENETARDGDLEAREVLQLDLEGTELVLLAGCETFLTAVDTREDTAGIGEDLTQEEKRAILRDLMRGDELVGLSRSFLLGGAASVIATQWQLSVRTAQTMLPLLGANLQSGLPRGEALRQATCSILADNPDLAANPWTWAPFILVGNWR